MREDLTSPSTRLARLSELRPYQLAGASFLLSSGAALLADEMGLGKTVQTAAALMLAEETIGRVLLVVPSSLCLNWLRELSRWAPNIIARRVIGSAEDRLATYRLPIKLLIVSFEQLRQDYRHISADSQFDLVIVDEAQRIKNSSSEVSLACRIIPRRFAWALTGTPVENHPEDLISIYRFVLPGLLTTGMSRVEIHDKIKVHFLRRTKQEVLRELPPIIYQDLRLELNHQQQQAYDDVWDQRYILSKDRDCLSYANMLAVITRLKQICNYDLCSGESCKFDALECLIESLVSPNEKILIFSQYVTTLNWLSPKLRVSNAVFHGGLTANERNKIVDAFENGPSPQALLLTYQAGGVGLNLQAASTVIVYDRWWNPAVEDQAIQRAHRFGRDRPLTVVRLMVEGTVEERIVEILAEKRDIFHLYVESALTGVPKQLSADVLLRILKLHD